MKGKEENLYSVHFLNEGIILDPAEGSIPKKLRTLANLFKGLEEWDIES